MPKMEVTIVKNATKTSRQFETSVKRVAQLGQARGRRRNPPNSYFSLLLISRLDECTKTGRLAGQIGIMGECRSEADLIVTDLRSHDSGILTVRWDSDSYSRVMRSSTLSAVNRGVEIAEFDASVCGGKLPVYFAVPLVPFGYPSCNLFLERFGRGDAPRQAMQGQRAQVRSRPCLANCRVCACGDSQTDPQSASLRRVGTPRRDWPPGYSVDSSRARPSVRHGTHRRREDRTNSAHSMRRRRSVTVNVRQPRSDPKATNILAKPFSV